MGEPISLRLLDIYRIGIGPSSSHTVGPMRAARFFRERCLQAGLTPTRLEVRLMGSLSSTGRGHGTDCAVLAGLSGWDPEDCDPDAVWKLPQVLEQRPWIEWGALGRIPLRPSDVRFLRYDEYRDLALPHPNTLEFHADGRVERWCSVGGGFVRPAEGLHDPDEPPPHPPHTYHDAESLLQRARELGGALGDVVLANERALEETPGDTDRGLDRIWDAFRACIGRGIERRGELPGGLEVQRRAADLLDQVEGGLVDAGYAPIARAQAYAFAVNEENAAGGRVVTAPTNGAAGIVPAVLVEAAERLDLSREETHRALATAAAIAKLVKTHASISGAEVGCQGEVGTATAMAAAALCQILGGDPDQVAVAAEIAIEHNLGLTCDPIRGLVQAPCIERNAMGVAKAWSAAQLSMHGTLQNVVSLDRVIRVMKRTGDDMHREYKETSEGGLAVSLPEC